MIDFNTYDRENPHIWEAFKNYAWEAKAKGFKNFGSKAIFELIRWHTKVKGNDGYKLNNNYTPDYAEKMEREFPAFEGFFRKKNRKAKRVN